jgi:hypothetical protein
MNRKSSLKSHIFPIPVLGCNNVFMLDDSGIPVHEGIQMQRPPLIGGKIDSVGILLAVFCHH